MKGRFSEDEWKLLKFLPFQAFFLVSAADGEVDSKEVEALTSQIEKAAMLLDDLHRELMVDLAREDQSAYLDAASPERLARTKETVRPLLRERLSDDEYMSFVRSLFISSIYVAKASGGGFLRLRNKVSEEEAEALAAIAMLYDVDVELLI